METFKIDCQHCYGFCCIALYLSKIDGFLEDKKAGQKCNHLDTQNRCKIYDQLLTKGSKGCKVYDCFNAGEIVTKMYPEQTVNQEMMDMFLKIYPLQQITWYLLQAKTYTQDRNIKKQIDLYRVRYQKIISKVPLEKEVDNYIADAKKLVKQISNTIQKEDKVKKKPYLQKDLSYQNLDNKDFSMTIMLASNLEGSSLKNTNFLGADIRDVNLKNTDLRYSLFLSQGQINSAIGNEGTKLPANLTVPSFW